MDALVKILAQGKDRRQGRNLRPLPTKEGKGRQDKKDGQASLKRPHAQVKILGMKSKFEMLKHNASISVVSPSYFIKKPLTGKGEMAPFIQGNLSQY